MSSPARRKRAGSSLAILLGVLCSISPAGADEDAAQIDEAALEARGAVIGKIIIEKRNVFDTSDPRESSFFYRLANRLHIATKDSVIKNQLLLRPGDAYSKRLADESERILRGNRYLYDATVTPQQQDDGSVALHVSTKEVWTLAPTLSVSRKGGENKTTIGAEEVNLMGRGQTLLFERTDDADRTASTFQFVDKNIGGSWIGVSLLAANKSDGDSLHLALLRPFYALDTRWSAGITTFDDERRTAFYELGNQAAEFRQQRKLYTTYGGWSKGLRNGWVRRYTAGVVYDDNEFDAVPDGLLPAVIPENRKLVYPFLGIEILEDAFETTSNRQQIARTEDFYTGTRLAATLGWANDSFGADRQALLYTASFGQGFGSMDAKALLLRADASGRQESGSSKNVLLSFDARYFSQQSDQRIFYATLNGALGHTLDLDNVVDLGGDTGLRGYPLRYQTGDSKLLATVEQRYYWNWYPFRLVRVGGAIFADVGRTWGRSPLGAESDGWLRDVGVGFRFAPTRTGSRRVAHLDFAFPLDGDPSIDKLQIILEGKSSF